MQQNAGSGNPDFYVSAIVAAGAPDPNGDWIKCGLTRVSRRVEGNLTELQSPPTSARSGDTKRPSPPRSAMPYGERVISSPTEVNERRTAGGGRVGVDGIRRALRLEHPRRAATRWPVQAVTDCWREPLQDDGTVAVLAIA